MAKCKIHTGKEAVASIMGHDYCAQCAEEIKNAQADVRCTTA
jgi:hypothetical protein